MNIVWRVIMVALVGFYVSGCKNANTSQAQGFNSPNASYTFQFKNNALVISSNGAVITHNKATLVVFLDIDCNQCKAYYEHLNHLLETYKSLYIVGILRTPVPKDSMLGLINENKLAFDVIMPTQEFDVIGYFLNNAPSPNNQPNNPLTIQDQQEHNNQHNAIEYFQPQDTPQATNHLSTQSPLNIPQDTKEMPFFILYNTQGQFYEYYQGIIPEEIFSSDIAKILE